MRIILRWKMSDINKHFCNIAYILRQGYRFSPKRVISIFVIALFQGISAMNVVLFYKYAMEALGKDSPLSMLVITVTIYLLLHLVNIAVNGFYNARFPVWNMKIKNGISKLLYKKYKTIDLIDIDSPEFYNKYIRALNEADNRAIEVCNTVQYFFSNLLSFTGIASVIITLDPILMFFAVLPVISSSLINLQITKERYQLDISTTATKRKLDYIQRVFLLPQYREELKTSKYHQLLIHKFEATNAENKEIIEHGMPSIVKKSVIGANLFSLMNYGLPIVYLGWLILSNRISIGEFSALLIGTANLSSSIFYMVILIPQLVQHSLFIDNLRVIMNYEPSIEKETNTKQVQQANDHAITVEKVSFRYHSDSEYVLKDISLSIGRGEKIALVGENGAGKSTLVKLLLRLYDPEKGILYFDDDKYQELGVTSLRDAISVVYQKIQPLALTIGENVLEREVENSIDEERVRTALQRSGLCEKVSTLSEKIYTPLTREFEENGIELSGGESQKLAIAKAICKDAGVIIMDEPTSSLDPLSEQEMYQRMIEMCEGKTLVLISHRLYSTKMVDRIYYMEKGMIVERGSHEELMQYNGKYAHMYRVQASQYRGEVG